jgi:hydroxypyruvate reductase
MHTEQMVTEALEIWRAGVAAVDASRLVRDVLRTSPEGLSVCGRLYPWESFGRLCVVGAGKAGAGMAAGVEEALGPQCVAERVCGWINVPADCVRTLRKIHLHPARPAGLNEPTAAGVEGSRRILDLVSRLAPHDVCLVLISGGGSALLPAPLAGITLEEKQLVTRLLMQGGATIHELNTVRKQLSEIKGGGLARAIAARQAETLIISDVVGDPLDIIASGPTVDDQSTPAQARDVLRRFCGHFENVPASVWRRLDQSTSNAVTRRGAEHPMTTVRNHLIGTNRVAVQAAQRKAEEFGYRVVDGGSDNTGEATEVGRELARECKRFRHEVGGGKVCFLSGGEPVVKLAPPGERGLGGRNQQLALAALDELVANRDGAFPNEIVVLSGGTDGEDGPTDAAGGWASAGVANTAQRLGLNAREFLARNDAYHFFEATGGLLKTGPTHTNVMDLRVCVVG